MEPITLEWRSGAPVVHVGGKTLADVRDVRYLPPGLRRRVRKAIRAFCGNGWAQHTVAPRWLHNW